MFASCVSQEFQQFADIDCLVPDLFNHGKQVLTLADAVGIVSCFRGTVIHRSHQLGLMELINSVNDSALTVHTIHGSADAGAARVSHKRRLCLASSFRPVNESQNVFRLEPSL